jgi:hypothetical protein
MKVIKLEIKETQKDSRLLLDDFICELESVKRVLESLNKDIHPNKTPQLSYEIVKIRKSSPLMVELLPTYKDFQMDDLIASFYTGLRTIPKGKPPKSFSVNTIIAYSDIGTSTKRNEITFYENGKSKKLKVKENYGKFVNEIYKQIYYSEQGSISGKLDALNVHGTKKTITVYPNYAPQVNCIVSDNLLPVVEKAVRRKVTVRGKIKTKIDEKYPFEINVDEIKIHKSKEEIPKVDELWGMIN